MEEDICVGWKSTDYYALYPQQHGQSTLEALSGQEFSERHSSVHLLNHEEEVVSYTQDTIQRHIDVRARGRFFLDAKGWRPHVRSLVRTSESQRSV